MKQLKIRGYDIIFSHTDSFMLKDFNTKDIDDAIKLGTKIIDDKYFHSNGILHFDISNLAIKGKFEELMILNQNSYIHSKTTARGKSEVKIAIAGLITTKENGLGITRRNDSIDDIISENKEAIFKQDATFFKKYEDMEVLYSTLKYRLTSEYSNKLLNMWFNNTDTLSTKPIVVSNTIKQINTMMQRMR